MIFHTWPRSFTPPSRVQLLTYKKYLTHKLLRCLWSIKLSYSTPCSYIGGEKVYRHTFLTLQLHGIEWLISRFGRFTLLHPPPPPTGEITTIPIELEVWWAPASVWKIWRREKSIFPGETQTPDRPARSLVTIYDLHMLEIWRKTPAADDKYAFRATAMLLTSYTKKPYWIAMYTVTIIVAIIVHNF